jgi:hypothetical protein
VYTAGFRIDPAEKLETVHRELLSLHQVYSVNPVFGVDFTVEEKASLLRVALIGPVCLLLDMLHANVAWQPASLDFLTAERVEDDVEIVQGDDQDPDAAAAYFADRSVGVTWAWQAHGANVTACLMKSFVTHAAEPGVEEKGMWCLTRSWVWRSRAFPRGRR